MPTEVDYELEAIQVRFDAGHKNALNEWRAAFDTARKQWQLDRARRLLHLLKARALDENYLGMFRFYEGALLLDLGEWKKAQKALEQSIEICRKLGDQKGELSAVNSLANLFRRNADTLESAIDTFQTALQSSLAVGVSKVILLNGLGLTLYEKGELQQANDYFQEVLNLAQQMSDDELRASALHNLGSVAWTRGKLHDAQVLLEQAQKIQRTAQDKHGLAETLNSLGLVLEGLGQWDEAIASYQNALEQMQTVSDFYGQSQVLVNLGNVYSLKNQSTLAISCHEQSYEIAKELGNPRLQGQALSALGDTYRLAGEFDKAEDHLQSAIAIKTKAGEARSLKHTWQSLAAVYHEQRRPVEAESAYKKGLQIARAQHDRRMEAFILLSLSRLFTAQEKFREANTFLRTAKEIATTEGYNDCLGWIYEEEGDIELLSEEPNASSILESFSVSLWHMCMFNEYELSKLIERLGRFWLAHAEDGQSATSLWFCESIIQLWKTMDQGNECRLVLEAFSSLRTRIMTMLQG